MGEEEAGLWQNETLSPALGRPDRGTEVRHSVAWLLDTLMAVRPGPVQRREVILPLET